MSAAHQFPGVVRAPRTKFGSSIQGERFDAACRVGASGLDLIPAPRAFRELLNVLASMDLDDFSAVDASAVVIPIVIARIGVRTERTGRGCGCAEQRGLPDPQRGHGRDDRRPRSSRPRVQVRRAGVLRVGRPSGLFRLNGMPFVPRPMRTVQTEWNLARRSAGSTTRRPETAPTSADSGRRCTSIRRASTSRTRVVAPRGRPQVTSHL
jgi:hypothetical protein